MSLCVYAGVCVRMIIFRRLDNSICSDLRRHIIIRTHTRARTLAYVHTVDPGVCLLRRVVGLVRVNVILKRKYVCVRM